MCRVVYHGFLGATINDNNGCYGVAQMVVAVAKEKLLDVLWNLGMIRDVAYFPWGTERFWEF